VFRSSWQRNADLNARICFFVGLLWLIYIGLDAILEIIFYAIKHRWTIGQTAANLK
jgi:hypothetical protein